MTETWGTAKVSIPLKEMESFLLHRVITTKNKPHFKSRLSKNQQDKSKRTSNKTNVKTVKQNSWKSATGKKIAKNSSPLLHSSVMNGRKKPLGFKMCIKIS